MCRHSLSMVRSGLAQGSMGGMVNPLIIDKRAWWTTTKLDGKEMIISLPIEVGRLPNPFESAFWLQHYTTIPIRPSHHSKVLVLNPFVLQPLIMHKQSFAQGNTSVHLEVYGKEQVNAILPTIIGHKPITIRLQICNRLKFQPNHLKLQNTMFYESKGKVAGGGKPQVRGG